MKYSNSFTFTFEELMSFTRNVMTITTCKATDKNLASVIECVLEGNIDMVSKTYREENNDQEISSNMVE